MWHYQNGFVVNEKGKVMDVSGGRDAENQKIISWKKHGGLNQQFDVVYADQWPSEPKKGELNPEFGFYVERPFYIVSELGTGRYLTTINGAGLAIKTKNGNAQQTWFFDQKTLTVKNMQNKKSMSINSSGNARSINVYNTNSQWYQIFKYEGQHICNFQNHKCLDVQGK
jgi:hypothetical protein